MGCVATGPPLGRPWACSRSVAALRSQLRHQPCTELDHTRPRSFTLDRPKLRCIVPDGDSSATRMLLLSDQVEVPQGELEPLGSHGGGDGNLVDILGPPCCPARAVRSAAHATLSHSSAMTA